MVDGPDLSGQVAEAQLEEGYDGGSRKRLAPGHYDSIAVAIEKLGQLPLPDRGTETVEFGLVERALDGGQRTRHSTSSGRGRCRRDGEPRFRARVRQIRVALDSLGRSVLRVETFTVPGVPSIACWALTSSISMSRG